VNFGWALTPLPKAIPVDGSTLEVWIDGQPVGRPTYNNYRVDVATAFPGLANSNGAVGYLHFDTSRYANGVHTIGWLVTDDAGVTEGLGSRFFTVVNSGMGAAAHQAGPVTAGPGLREARGEARTDPERLMLPAADPGPVYVKRGYDRLTLPDPVHPDSQGMIQVEAQELDRIEISLGAMPIEPEPAREAKESRTSNGPAVRRFMGYLSVGDELRPLPAGSTLDSISGSLTWQLWPGFLGPYDLVFVDNGSAESTARTWRVRVSIRPKGSPIPPR
jgi:hypothetical protein